MFWLVHSDSMASFVCTWKGLTTCLGIRTQWFSWKLRMNSFLGTRSFLNAGGIRMPILKTIVLCSFWPECPLVWFLFLATTLQISRVWERMVVVSRNQSRQNLWMWGLGSEVSSGKLIHRWRPKLGTATKPSSRRRLLQDSGRWTRQCSLFCISVVTFGYPFTFDIFYFCLHCLLVLPQKPRCWIMSV